MPTITLADLRGGLRPLRLAGEMVYVLSGSTGNEADLPLYIGTSHDFAERMRRHLTRRRPGSGISRIDDAIKRFFWSGSWRLAAARPAAFLPFVVEGIEALRVPLRSLGLLPDRLDRRLAALLDGERPWSSSAAVVEWSVIALSAPIFNDKGNCYLCRNGRPARPIDLLRRFAELAERAAA